MSIIEEMEKEISALYKKIADIQAQCSHPEAVVTKVAQSYTGNWCEYDNTYWWEFNCDLCKKRWSEPQ
jgi:hypothetical protein